MTFIDFIPLLAGLGLFLFGMSMMGSALEQIAGSHMEKTLERLTSNRFFGMLLGVAVTGIIQSSSATTVMLIGFVNAGIMKLTQAVSVIMGANVGTTVTSQLIRLSEIGEGVTSWMSLLKPASFAPILIVIGAGIQLFVKKKRTKDIGMMLLGFGMLFFGMNVMETTLSPLRSLPAFAAAFTTFENPLLGILLGAGVTAVIQSSSASVGLLQALATTGAINFSMMVPIILGQNIGTCITALLASIGAKRSAKRVAMIHLYFNVIGTVIFFAAIYGYQTLVGIPFFENPVGMGDIANFHTIFNLVNTALLLPFCGGLVKLANITIRDKKSKDKDEEAVNLLDERFFATPSVAIDICRKMLVKMAYAAVENVRLAGELLKGFDRKILTELEDNERFCDKAESSLTGYLVKVTSLSLSNPDSHLASEMLRSLSDFERISDRAVNIAEVSEYNLDNNIAFTEKGMLEIGLLSNAVNEILQATLKAYENQDPVAASHVEPFEQVIDVITETLKGRHVDRLQAGECSIQAGISFMELLTNYERIADHCSNIAIYIIQLNMGDSDFDRHEHVRQLHEGLAADYKSYYANYENRYYKPLMDI